MLSHRALPRLTVASIFSGVAVLFHKIISCIIPSQPHRAHLIDCVRNEFLTSSSSASDRAERVRMT